MTEPVKDLLEYSRNRFAQANQKRTFCPAQVMGVEKHAESEPSWPWWRQSLVLDISN